MARHPSGKTQTRSEKSLVLFGLAVGSSLCGAAPLVVSELFTHAVRHAQQSPDAEFTLTAADRRAKAVMVRFIPPEGTP
ncbi:hypothetical protein AB0F18_20390 [Streptomyces sp. NPDC029216]|uniref:hypothetical protein n=1 Tax=Streptomyces sp. NPDC029216 TaxID=3154701 RepID=UPI0033DEFBB4